MLELFETVDAILGRTGDALRRRRLEFGQETFVLDDRGSCRCEAAISVSYTQPLSFIGLPVVTVPVDMPGGLPVGIQIIAAPWREDVALRIAHALERMGIAAAPAPPR